MNNEVIDEAKVETKTAAAAVAVDAFEEFGTVEITGNFRGYWRDVPLKDNPSEKRRMFKLSRSIKRKRDGAVVRQAAWVTEADAKAKGLVDGVKYNLTLSVEETLTPSKQNGDDRYVDEYSFGDATIISVNS